MYKLLSSTAKSCLHLKEDHWFQNNIKCFRMLLKPQHDIISWNVHDCWHYPHIRFCVKTLFMKIYIISHHTSWMNPELQTTQTTKMCYPIVVAEVLCCLLLCLSSNLTDQHNTCDIQTKQCADSFAILIYVCTCIDIFEKTWPSGKALDYLPRNCLFDPPFTQFKLHKSKSIYMYVLVLPGKMIAGTL